MAKNSLRRLQEKGPRNTYLVRWALIGGVAAVLVVGLLLLTQPSSSRAAQPPAPAVNNTPVLPPVEPPVEPVNDTPSEVANATDDVNETDEEVNDTEAVNETEEVDDAEDTEDDIDTENDTAEEDDTDEAEPIVRPKKSKVLQRVEILLGGKTSAASCYIAEDEWMRLDGVVSADVDFTNHHGIVIYADWMVSEDEILDAIYPRFSSTVVKRDTCTYDANINTYCCPKEICQYVKGLSDDIG
jgi:hypothetical protein